MLGGTICMIDRKAIFYRILSYRIIAGIIDFFIYDRLDGRVLGCVDLKTAGIYQVACLAFSIA